MKKASSILLVEDEQTLATGLVYNLSSEGYDVTWARDGKEGLQQIKAGKYDLVILDIMLPYVDGFDIAEQIRATDQQLPVLFLTARSGIKDRIKGLELGADDYMTKPFHLEELLLKVKGILRRKSWYRESADKTPVYRFGANEINFGNLKGKSGEQEIHLTLYEAMLLKYLIEHKGSAVSRGEILEKVWNINSEIETRTVDNFIVRLRKYFETDPDHPVYIKSVRGVGYIFAG